MEPPVSSASCGLERGLEVFNIWARTVIISTAAITTTLATQPGPGSVNTRRPNPLFGVIRTIANDEIANYESMSVIYHQRLTHGLQMQASYTWSHALDISSDSNGGGTPTNPYNWRADYGNSNWDIRRIGSW